MEICLLFGDCDEISRGDVEDYFHDSGQLPGDDDYSDYSDEGDLSCGGTVERFVEDVFQCLAERSGRAKKWYPLSVGADSVLRTSSDWRDFPAHVSLLLANLSCWYPKSGLDNNPSYRLLFERVTAASLNEIFGLTIVLGTSARPGEDLETAVAVSRIMAAINEIARVFNIEAKATKRDVRPTDQDLGLDVLSRVNLRDERPGGLYVLTQCSTSTKWHTVKRGEPSLDLWADLVGWDGMRVCALAVPYQDTEPFDLKRHSKRCGAVILDRDRLLLANPDKRLTAETRAKLLVWCVAQAGGMPEHTVD